MPKIPAARLLFQLVELSVRRLRVGELVFVEVQYGRNVSRGWRRQTTKFGQIHHVGAEDRVPRRGIVVEARDFLGEGESGVTHAPFPLCGGQCEYSEVMGAALHPSLKEGFVAAAVIGVES